MNTNNAAVCVDAYDAYLKIKKYTAAADLSILWASFCAFFGIAGGALGLNGRDYYIVAAAFVIVAAAGLVFFAVRRRWLKKKVASIFDQCEIVVSPQYWEAHKNNSKMITVLDELAVERCSGNIKAALRYAVESTELTRAERFRYLIGREMYELDYLKALFGEDLMNVAPFSRKAVLTRAAILKELSGMKSLRKLDAESFEILEACCTRKDRSPEMHESDTEDFYLVFEGIGRFEVGKYSKSSEQVLIYAQANEGELFFIIRHPAIKDILLVYSAEEWEPDEELNRQLVKETPSTK